MNLSSRTSLQKHKIMFVLGGPGSGKGTQCNQLVDKYGFIHLSAGDLLRKEVSEKSNNGLLISRLIKEGKIVPAQITVDLLINAISSRDSSQEKVFLIDGFPRNIENLQTWERTYGRDVEGVLFYECPETLMEERILKRSKTSGRTDDNMESIRKRFKTYLEETLPVIDYFKEKQMVKSIDACQTIQQVSAETQKAVQDLI